MKKISLSTQDPEFLKMMEEIQFLTEEQKQEIKQNIQNDIDDCNKAISFKKQIGESVHRVARWEEDIMKSEILRKAAKILMED